MISLFVEMLLNLLNIKCIIIYGRYNLTLAWYHSELINIGVAGPFALLSLKIIKALKSIRFLVAYLPENGIYCILWLYFFLTILQMTDPSYFMLISTLFINLFQKISRRNTGTRQREVQSNFSFKVILEIKIFFL